MSLTAKQVQHFQETGFVVVPDFYPRREILSIRSEVERLKREGKLRNVATDGDGKTHSQKQVNLQLCPMYQHSDLFRALPFDPKVIEAVTQLIGEPFILQLDQVFLKPGGHGMGTSWHTDNSYFKIKDPTKATGMWIAVHDANVANGTMHVIPGSFRTEYEHSRDPNSDHHIRCYPPEDQAVACEMPAGGVLFFNYGTAHCTLANKTDKERAGAAFHFLRADYAQPELLAEDRDYRPYLTGPKATGGKKEYGRKIAGTWDAEVERLLKQAVAA